VKNLKQSFWSTTRILLVGGIALFTLGLLIILRLNPLFNLLSQVIPDAAAVEVTGVVTQFVGQALVVFGAMRSTSQGVISSMQTERRITMEGFARNIQQLQNTFLVEQHALKTGYSQTIAKIDALIANQKALEVPMRVPLPSSCKFCGAKIEKGSFCPQCGKAN
jgi:hypothetical protein